MPLRSNVFCIKRKSEKKQSLDFSKAVFIYMLGGLVGTLWETIWFFHRRGHLVYSNGSMITPFNFVYGFGALVIIYGLKNREKLWQVFLIGALGGGAVEYMLSFLEELVLGTRSWDYSYFAFNINGRTSLLHMVFWGILSSFVIFVVYKPYNRLLDKIPKHIRKKIAYIMAAYIVIDWIITVGALIRYTARHAGRKPLSFLGKFIDYLFPDHSMRKHFPNMRL